MSKVTRVLVLTGGREGYTGKLGNWFAREGKITLVGTPAEVEGQTLYLGRSFRAYQEGSDELAAYRERCNGKSSVQEAAQPGTANPNVGGLPTQQPGPPPAQADNGSGADDAASAGTGSVSDGSGPEHTGNDQKIREAVMALDVANDDHWTQEGLPRVDAVANILGKQDITRRDLTRAAAGMVRPAM